MSANEICGTLLGEDCNPIENPQHNWTMSIPPFSRLRKSMFYTPLFFRWSFLGRGEAKKQLKVLQITDIHLDAEYHEGTNAVCGEPLCCRKDSPGEVTHSSRAGYWGDYRDCDIPLRLVEETFKSIRANHPDIDYIIFTGDIPAHDIWNQTRESQIQLIDTVTDLLDKYFHSVPIFPVVGNHESLPMNR